MLHISLLNIASLLARSLKNKRFYLQNLLGKENITYHTWELDSTVWSFCTTKIGHISLPKKKPAQFLRAGCLDQTDPPKSSLVMPFSTFR